MPRFRLLMKSSKQIHDHLNRCRSLLPAGKHAGAGGNLAVAGVEFDPVHAGRVQGDAIVLHIPPVENDQLQVFILFLTRDWRAAEMKMRSMVAYMDAAFTSLCVRAQENVLQDVQAFAGIALVNALPEPLKVAHQSGDGVLGLRAAMRVMDFHGLVTVQALKEDVVNAT